MEIRTLTQKNTLLAALTLHRSGELRKAESAYRDILLENPVHSEAIHYLGVLLHQIGQSEEAIALLNKANALDNSHAYRYNELGNILTQTGDLDKAETAFRQALALRLDDQGPNIWNNLGSILHRKNDFAGAETAYRNALSQDGGFVPALNNLAALLQAQGRLEESSATACLAYIQPPFDGKPPRILGYAYYQLGRLDAAADCYRAWLAAEPGNPYALHHLAACTGENPPVKAAAEYLTMLFDGMAGHFEDKLVNGLGYRGPEILGELLRGRVAANRGMDVLDGGCGTGLCAAELAPYARRLAGVDLSPAMLAEADAKQLYHELTNREIGVYLSDRRHAFDLIAMIDTLIYFGDLGELFKLVRQALRPGGLFAFTVEAAEPGVIGYRLNPSGRFRHGRDYLREVLGTLNFAVLHIDEAVVRWELGKPAPGFGVLAQAGPD